MTIKRINPILFWMCLFTESSLNALSIEGDNSIILSLLFETFLCKLRQTS